MARTDAGLLTDRAPNPDDISDASGYKGWAERVFAPPDEKEVSEILRQAAAKKMPVTALGAGSGLTGARVALGGWAVSLEKFRRLEIAPGHARAGAAVRLFEVNEAAQPSGQFYAPDPTENTASIGGTISTNASGSRTFRYGSTRNHVEALRVALMGGGIREFRRGEPVDFEIPLLRTCEARKCSAGYALRPGMDWIDLFCGAEGTLGIILEAELKLLPIPPHLFAGVVFFSSEEDALDAVDAWRSIAELRLMEYFDRGSLQLLRARRPEIPRDADAALLIEAEGDEMEAWERRMEEARALIEASWFAAGAQDRERFRKLRHGLPEMVNATMLQRGLLKMGSDFAVPVHQNRAMLRYYRDRLDRELPGQYVVYGHIGDAHLHVNMLPLPGEQFATASRLMDEFAAKAVELGGVVAAEHGLGKRKAHYLQLQYSPREIEAMRAVKRRLDPDWLLGRGTLFAVPESAPQLYSEK